MYETSSRQRAMAFAVVAVGAGVLFVDACGLVFDCGCTSLWAGGSALCNVHSATGPHCPWCAHPVAGATALFGVVFAQAGLIYGPLPVGFRSFGLRGRFVAAMLAFPVVATALGLMHGTWYGYWG